jgi:hypothetical protein
MSFCEKLAFVVIGAMPDASDPAPTSSWPSE